MYKIDTVHTKMYFVFSGCNDNDDDNTNNNKKTMLIILKMASFTYMENKMENSIKCLKNKYLYNHPMKVVKLPINTKTNTKYTEHTRLMIC